MLGVLVMSLAAAGWASPRAAAAAPSRSQPQIQAQPQIFYQIFFRSFRDSNGDRIGDLRGLTSKLGYIKRLGATTLLLTPLQPSPYYHNYFATAFKAIDPAYGTMADYFAFIRAAHALGLEVYLDEEFQYVAQGHPWWRESICKPRAPFADYLLWKDGRHCIAQPFLDKPRWQGYDGRWIGIAMVNLENPAVQRYFTKLLMFWADPHGDGSGHDGVDGFRIDHMMDDLDHKGLDTHLFANFWAPMFRALKARRPELKILAEQADWGYGHKWLTRGHVDMVFAFPLRGALVSLDKKQIVSAIRATAAATPPGKTQLIFLENHDVDRYMSAVGDNPERARAGAAIALTLAGDPLIYYGQELGMRGRAIEHDQSDEVQIPSREAFRWRRDLLAPGSAIWYRRDRRAWDVRYNRSDDGVSLEEEKADPSSLYHWYSRLLALRHARPELSGGSQRLVCNASPDVLCILRQKGQERTLLLVNLGDHIARPALSAELAAKGDWKDLLSGGDASPAGVVLRPLQVMLLGTP
ncbi:MAG TPA: alpha-amylase family glycosyl hydrolase [Steroidobacteraceae bacterium]|nr:alpha-amylase family glycosyl hydrolase [Steroidobacteraceae bacterium]